MAGDLHTHTTYSDGSTPVEKLPQLAACAGLTHLAVTDHDSMAGVRYAYAHPEQCGVQVIPGVELSAYDMIRDRKVHLLCYWPDDCTALEQFCTRMAARRREALLRSCQELEARCPQFKTEDALAFAKASGTLFKAHIMRALWQYGLADGMYRETYRKLFSAGPVRGEVYHAVTYDSVDAVLEVAQASRAVVVLAHPSVYRTMELCRELAASKRIDGVEIEHPRNTPEDKAELYRIAARHDLIVTGGTDYHGMNTNHPHPVGTCMTDDGMIFRITQLACRRKNGGETGELPKK